MKIEVPYSKEELLAMPFEKAVEIVRSCVPDKVKTLESVLLGMNGKFVSIALDRPAKVRKSSDLIDKIRKTSFFVVQPDISYLNKASVKAAHESGERERTINPNDIHLSKVLVYNVNTSKLRLGFGTIKNPNLPRKSAWLVDGKEVELESIASALLASETAEKPESDWLTLLPDNIVSINRQDNIAFEK